MLCLHCFLHSVVTRIIEHLCSRHSLLSSQVYIPSLAHFPLDFYTRGLRVKFLWKPKEKLSRPSGDFPATQRSTGVKISCQIILSNRWQDNQELVSPHNGELWHPLQLHKLPLTVLHHITTRLTVSQAPGEISSREMH